MEGSDNKRAFKCAERKVGWLRLDGLDTTHLNKNSWNCEIHSEAVKGTQFSISKTSGGVGQVRRESLSGIVTRDAKLCLL